MKRSLWITLFVLLVFTIGFTTATVWPREQTTTSRLSPDETLIARIVQTSPAWYLERNFEVRIEDRRTGISITVFYSPDEGHPGSTERLIWSKDGTKLLVVGRHCYVKEDLLLDNGDQAYFLHDRSTGRSWTNSDNPMIGPQLKPEMLKEIEFTEAVILKPR